MRLLKSQSHLALILRSNCDVEVFECQISIQGSPNDFKFWIGLDASENSVELSVVSKGDTQIRADARAVQGEEEQYRERSN